MNFLNVPHNGQTYGENGFCYLKMTRTVWNNNRNKAEHVMRVRTLFDYDCRSSPLYRGKVEVTSDWPFFTDNWSCDQVAKIMGSERFILDRENGTRKKICRSATTLFTRQSSRRLIYSTWVEKIMRQYRTEGGQAFAI